MTATNRSSKPFENEHRIPYKVITEEFYAALQVSDIIFFAIFLPSADTTEIVQPCSQKECKETAIQATNEKVLNPKQIKKLIPPKKSSVSKPAVFVEVMRRPEIQVKVCYLH